MLMVSSQYINGASKWVINKFKSLIYFWHPIDG
jgi:hypothetical protein